MSAWSIHRGIFPHQRKCSCALKPTADKQVEGVGSAVYVSTANVLASAGLLAFSLSLLQVASLWFCWHSQVATFTCTQKVRKQQQECAHKVCKESPISVSIENKSVSGSGLIITPLLLFMWIALCFSSITDWQSQIQAQHELQPANRSVYDWENFENFIT